MTIFRIVFILGYPLLVGLVIGYFWGIQKERNRWHHGETISGYNKTDSLGASGGSSDDNITNGVWDTRDGK